MTFEFFYHQSRGDIPKPDATIPAGTQQSLLISAKVNGGNDISMSDKIPDLLPCIDFPQLQRIIQSRGEKIKIIGVKKNVISGSCFKFEIGKHFSCFQVVDLHRTIPAGRDDLGFVMTKMYVE